MPPRFTEALAIQTQNERPQSEVPAAETSRVQALSQEGSFRHDMRKRVRGLVSGRFLGMYDVSHAVDTGLKFSRRRDAQIDAADAEFPPVEKVATAFGSKGLKQVSDYQEPGLIVTHSRQDLAGLAAAVSAKYGEVQMRYPNKFCKDFFASTAAHYARGIQSNPTVTEKDSPKVSSGVGYMDSGDLEFSSDDSFQPYMVEAPFEVKIGGNDTGFILSSLTNRIKRRNAARCLGEQGMTPELAAHLALQSALEEEPLNEEQFVILDGVPVVAGRYVAVAHNYKGIPTVDWIPNILSARGRLRKVYRGKPIEVK